MDGSDPRLSRVWNQTRTPVALRGLAPWPLLVRLPYHPTNREWLQDERRAKPAWVPGEKAWSVPRAWLEDVLRRALGRYGAVYVIQPFRATERCAPACWNAVGAECECSCMGAHHGSGNPAGKWHIVSETFAVRIAAREFSCRLLRPPTMTGARAGDPVRF